MLVMDVLALRTVDLLDLAQEIHLAGLATLDPQDAVRVQRAFGQRLTFSDFIAFFYQQAQRGRDFMFVFIPLLVGDENLALFHADLAGVFRCNGGFSQCGNQLAGFDLLLVLDLDLPFLGHVKLIVDHFAVFHPHHAHIGVLVRLDDAHQCP